MIDQAQRRLLLALVASALLHVWLVQTADMGSARRVTTAGRVPMSATLHVPQFGLAMADATSRPRNAVQSRETTDSVVSAAAQRAAVTARAPEPPSAPAAIRVAAASPTMPVTASDPTYYPARSLDVYPRALTALDLGGREQAGTVRATVLIDEAGTVNEVRAIEASAAELENAARALLLRARFTPAAKDGRPVKAQLLVSLEYREDGARH